MTHLKPPGSTLQAPQRNLAGKVPPRTQAHLFCPARRPTVDTRRGPQLGGQERLDGRRRAARIRRMLAGPASIKQMEGDWRDWANHPEAITAMWPRVLASGMPPASYLALLGTCQRTRNTVLCEAPRVKMAVQLGPEQPRPAPLLRLLKQSGRTQPTTLALLNSSTGQPATTTHPASTSHAHSNYSNTTPTATPPQEASSRAQDVITSFHALSCITRLDLQGGVVDPPLLQAMQGLPALTHLHLTNILLPAYKYQAANLPQAVHTFSIKLDEHQQPRIWQAQASLTSLLTEFLVLDTITDLTVDDIIGNLENFSAQELFDAFGAAMAGGRQARALRRLSVPHGSLTDDRSRVLKRAAPLLEELQVLNISLHQRVEDDGVSWRTLRIHDLDLTACRYLPLGGTQPLDIHVISGRLCGYEPDSTGGGALRAAIMHLTSPQTRPVRLVGSGADGGTFSWHSISPSPIWVTGLSVLQLSKAPVRRLGIYIGATYDADQLLLALQPLSALTQLTFTPMTWYADGPTQDQLLARLPLHLTHVHLGMDAFARRFCRDQPPQELFKRMAVAASTLPGRQAHPLHLCVAGTGPGSQVWEAVARCRARGDMGVVMEEAH